MPKEDGEVDLGSPTKYWKDLYVSESHANTFRGTLEGQATTVTTIPGLAPDTATTQANQPNITTSEADIKTSLLSDKFITMNIVQSQDYFNIRYQIKPLMVWIWFSVLLIATAGFLRIIKTRYEN